MFCFVNFLSSEKLLQYFFEEVRASIIQGVILQYLFICHSCDMRVSSTQFTSLCIMCKEGRVSILYRRLNGEEEWSYWNSSHLPAPYARFPNKDNNWNGKSVGIVRPKVQLPELSSISSSPTWRSEDADELLELLDSSSSSPQPDSDSDESYVGFNDIV